MKKIILIILMFLFVSANSQNICKTEVCVVEFNAGWNKANSVDNIVVVPTIIIFNGEEVKRYQADLSFTMSATRKEVQDEVDELIMSDF